MPPLPQEHKTAFEAKDYAKCAELDRKKTVLTERSVRLRTLIEEERSAAAQEDWSSAARAKQEQLSLLADVAVTP